MTQSLGPNLAIDPPRDDDLLWLHRAMGAKSIYEPLSLPAPPSLDDIQSRELRLVDAESLADGQAYHVDQARFLIVRRRQDERRLAFFVHFGWDYATDKTREMDLALAPGEKWNLGLLFEAQVLAAVHLFIQGQATRLRWRSPSRGLGALRWYSRLAARHVGIIEEPHPVTGAPLKKEVYDVTRTAFEKHLTERGLDITIPCASWPTPLWDLLRP